MSGKRQKKRGLRMWWFALLLLAAMTVFVAVSYNTVPMQNTTGDHFDALIVLGSPDTFDGKPTQEQITRVAEAVREYKRGKAPYIVVSGGPTLNHFVESQMMASLAVKMGVPETAIVQENRARDTYQNIEFSQQIFDDRGWRRAEVISSAQHIHRAAVLLQRSHLEWQVHAAPNAKLNVVTKVLRTVEEAIAVAMLRCFGMKMRPVIHAVGLVQAWIKYTLRWSKYAAQDLIHGRKPHIPYRRHEG